MSYRAKSTRKVDLIVKSYQILGQKIAPFLKYWKDFEEDGFDVVDINGNRSGITASTAHQSRK